MERLEITKDVSEDARRIYEEAVAVNNLGVSPEKHISVKPEDFDEAVNMWLRSADRDNRNPLLLPGYDLTCRPFNFAVYSGVYTTLLALGISNMTDADFIPTLSYVGASWIIAAIFSAFEVRRRAQNSILKVVGIK